MSQTVSLEGGIQEYGTYYISSFDIQTGASTVQMFRYRLHSDSYPVYAKLWFRVSMLSPSLGVHSPQTIVELEINPIHLKADLYIDNRDLSTTTAMLYDLDSPPNAYPISGSLIDVIDPGKFDALLSSVITSGKLADGEYRFEVKVYSGSDINNLRETDSDSKTIIVQTPVSVDLESPGGSLADTSDNVIYALYPIFQWYAQTCAGCETSIRIGEFASNVHSSVEDAIEDERVVPFDQTRNWEPLGSVSSYQFPLSGVRPLEFGSVYVWQVKQTLPTTTGLEDIISPIYAFKIENMGAGPSAASGLHTVLMALQQSLGSDQYNALFGPGSALLGYTPEGEYTINGVPIDETTVVYVLNQILNRNIIITNIQIED